MRRVIGVLLLVAAFVFGGVLAAWADAEEAEPAGLSLEQAIERALQHSTMIKQAELNVDRAQEVADAAWDANNLVLRKTWQETEDVYLNVPGTEDSWLGAIATDRKWHIQRASLSMTGDAVILLAKQSYYDVIKQETVLAGAEASLEKAERDYRAAQAMATVGMATSMQVDGARAKLEQARSTLEQARGDYEGAYRELNKLIGLRVDERPVLSTGIEFEPAEIPSIDAAITRALSVDYNPALWSAREGYELQRYVWTSAETQKAGKIDIEKAQLTYQDAREDTRNKMYELYDGLKSLEAAHESATAGVAAAEQALRTAELKYELGMVTRADVLDAQAKLAQAQEGLYQTRILYAATKETFAKPWLASPSAGEATGEPEGSGL